MSGGLGEACAGLAAAIPRARQLLTESRHRRQEDAMTARYHVLASDEIMASDQFQWPRGLRPVEQEPTDPGRYPGMHWWLFEDDDAPPELDGKRIELTLVTRYDDQGNRAGSEISSRTVMP